jgi:hypothetical protein
MEKFVETLEQDQELKEWFDRCVEYHGGDKWKVIEIFLKTKGLV